MYFIAIQYTLFLKKLLPSLIISSSLSSIVLGLLLALRTRVYRFLIVRYTGYVDMLPQQFIIYVLLVDTIRGTIVAPLISILLYVFYYQSTDAISEYTRLSRSSVVYARYSLYTRLFLKLQQSIKNLTTNLILQYRSLYYTLLAIVLSILIGSSYTY